MEGKKHFSKKYLRKGALPSTYCAGCGAGIITNCFLKAVEELGFESLDGFVFCSGIGCAAWICSPYFNADTIHVTHGRSIPAAAGIKLANPKLKVVVFGGDGDLAGIGLNHLVQAARRNIEILVIMVNNFIYGMTGGQVAPTTPLGVKTTTTPYGNVEAPFDMVNLMIGADASFVARWTTAHPIQLKNTIKKALILDSFSFIEVLSQCPTIYGTRAGYKDSIEMMNWFKTNTMIARGVVKEERAHMKGEEKKILVGEFSELKREGLASLTHKFLREVATIEAG